MAIIDHDNRQPSLSKRQRLIVFQRLLSFSDPSIADPLSEPTDAFGSQIEIDQLT